MEKGVIRYNLFIRKRTPISPPSSSVSLLFVHWCYLVLYMILSPWIRPFHLLFSNCERPHRFFPERPVSLAIYISLEKYKWKHVISSTQIMWCSSSFNKNIFSYMMFDIFYYVIFYFLFYINIWIFFLLWNTLKWYDEWEDSRK